MTNKEKATALMAVMGDETRAWGERIAAQLELNALKKATKVGWDKLGVTQKWLEWFEDSQAAQHDALPPSSPDLAVPHTGELGGLGVDLSTVTNVGLKQEPEGSDPSDDEAASAPADDPAPADLPHQPDPADLPHQPDPLEEAVMPEQVAAQPETVARIEVAGERGLISAEVRRLLLGSDAPYSEIEAAVKAKYPHAKTTTRSIASVAADMRKDKKPVAIRRPAAVSK